MTLGFANSSVLMRLIAGRSTFSSTQSSGRANTSKSFLIGGKVAQTVGVAAGGMALRRRCFTGRTPGRRATASAARGSAHDDLTSTGQHGAGYATGWPWGSSADEVSAPPKVIQLIGGRN